MIGHEAPSENVAVRGESFLNLSEEEQVVPPAKKDPLLVVSPVIGVVSMARNELHSALLGVGRLLLVKSRLTLWLLVTPGQRERPTAVYALRTRRLVPV